MGGRPTVVGLLAVAVAVLLTSAVAVSPATAEFRIPGVFEPKAKTPHRKQIFRPTMPRRNPTRLTAGVSAAAVSPEVADKSEAAVVAGTASSASVALALAPSTPSTPEVQAAAKPAADASDAEPAAEESADSKAEEPAEDAETVESAENGTKPDEATEDESLASDSEGEDKLTGTAETAQTEAEGDDAPAETAEAPAAEPVEDEAPAEIAAVEPPAPDTADAKTSAAEDAEETAADETKEIEETVTAAIAEVAPEDEAEAVPTEAEAKPVVAPSHDASVVLDVSPPPDDLRVAAATPEAASEDVTAETAEDAETSDEPAEAEATAKAEEEVEEKVGEKVDEKIEDEAVTDENVEDEVVEDEKVETEETKVAALTPPSAPASSEPNAEEEAAEPAALDTAPSEAEKVETEDAPPATDAERAETPGEDDTVVEEAAPPPPPAHPVVAAIRAKLESPSQYKGAAASDLKALSELYGERTEPPLWVTDSGFSAKAEAIMAEIRKADDWGLEATSFSLPSAGAAPLSEDAQAEAEIKLSIAILGYARDAQIGRLSPSNVSKLFDQHPSLRDPKKVLTEMAASDAPDRYLLSLHPQHKQFQRLQQALARARDSAKATGRDPNSDRKVQLIVINMERWRWLPRDMGNYHVWNNVPEFNVRVMKNGEPIYQEKTIVGQYKYATPLFSARMRNIVFHPNWTVPPTIIKEDLAPKLQGPGGGGFFGSSKEAMLRRYGLSANYKGQKIDADTVDWNNVNIHAYMFTQDPGPANVLGQFKFNFPNKHAIYMHDTPQRELFAERTRTLSHGCIRVNQPDRFAALLLSEDKGWSMGQVRNLVDRGPSSSTVIALNRHVPVHLTYFTAIVGESGQVTDFGDIYGLDSRMAPMLFSNPASFPVPATPAVAEEGSSARTQAQAPRRPSGGFDNFISGLFGN